MLGWANAAMNLGIYEVVGVGVDELDVCRPRTACKKLSSVATESLANECNGDVSPTSEDGATQAM
jgi:hypothetical protein